MTDFKSETGDRYGLVWTDHPEEVHTRCKTEIPTLKMIDGRNIWAVDAVKQTSMFDNYYTRPHILIEGDNYHALKVLEFTHRGKIDVIYIDPPYNTGNRDFMYNDKFVDKEDGYSHSKWLSFMYKRLLLTRELLSDTGVILISIDDNEQAQLKLLCDRVFGEENFITNFIWKRKKTGTNLSNTVNTNHEYVLCYAKNFSKIFFARNQNIDMIKDSYKNPDNDIRGPYTTKPLYADSNTNKKQKLIMPDGRTIDKQWFTNQATFNRLVKEKLIYWTTNKVPRQKVFLSNYKGTLFNTILGDVGTNNNGTMELKNILDRSFITIKPVSLIKHLMSLTCNKDSIILDFFAGSGTTGHAVLELNKEDNGNRQFILCTNNENNICTDVCYPRIKKVIEGYKTPKGKVVGGIPANLVYFTCGRNKEGSSAFMPVIEDILPDTLKLKVAQHSTGIIRTLEGTYIEESRRPKDAENIEDIEYRILRNGGKKEHGNKYVAIHYTISNEYLKELRDKMNAIKGEGIGKVLYYFTLDNKPNEEDFEDWDNINLKPFPEEFFNKFLTIAKKGKK